MSGKKIFIGGTGRSGTTILSKHLGKHRNVVRIPGESRFIVDKDGVLDLYYSLSLNYSLDQGRIAIRRFKELIYSMYNPSVPPYLFYGVLNQFGLEWVDSVLNDLIKNITDGSFVGWDYRTEFSDQTDLKCEIVYNKAFNSIVTKLPYRARRYIAKLRKNNRPKEEIYIPRYFSNGDKEVLLAYLKEFVEALFEVTLRRNGKKVWCEDTPANMMHLRFLSKLFPDAYFVHIVRNPIGVAFSMRKQIWAPYEWKDISNFLCNLYRVLIDNERWALENGIRYKRVHLEDLASDKEKFIELLDFLELEDDFEKEVIFEEDKVNYWQTQIVKEDYVYLKNELASFVEYYGYGT